jgi:hypothetical protein
VVKARNELVLVVDFLEHEQVDPLPRLILRSKAIFKLGNALCDALLSWPLRAVRVPTDIFNANMMVSGDIRQFNMNRPAGDHSTPAPPPEKKATEQKKKGSQDQKKK